MGGASGAVLRDAEPHHHTAGGFMGRNAFVFLVLAVFVALPGLLQAQIRSVTGRVTIAETNEPLEGARVMIRGTTVGTYTDAQGNFPPRTPADARAPGLPP